MYNPNLIIRNIRQKLTVGILPKEKKKKNCHLHQGHEVKERLELFPREDNSM